MADGSEREWSGDEWCTPPEIWERARWGYHGAFFDPFPNAESTVPHTHHAADGFAEEWTMGRRGMRCFVNPPFSRAGEAVRKCVVEYLYGCEIVAVIPSSVHATHWVYVDEAPAVCYPKQRVSFMRGGVQRKGNRADVVIVYWGDSPWRFREAFRDYGRVRLG